MEAIVGGVIGGVVLVLLLLAIIVVAVYLLQKRKSNKYKAMSAVGTYLTVQKYSQDIITSIEF